MATDIDWANLSFGYRKTNYNVRCTYRDGKWGEIEVSDSEYINKIGFKYCLLLNIITLVRLKPVIPNMVAQPMVRILSKILPFVFGATASFFISLLIS